MVIPSVVDFYSQTDIGKELLQQGHEEGREEGREEGTVRTLAGAIQVRFGADPRIDGLATFLAQNLDVVASIRLINEATSLKQLLTRMVPEGH